MKRKIVKHGAATLTISLPSKWVKQFGIAPGDELEVIADSGELIIKGPQARERNFDAAIDLDQLKTRDIIIPTMRALYKAGVDTIHVKYSDQKAVKEFVLPELDQFIGFEIMHQTDAGCVLKEVSGLTDNTGLDGLIRRSFLLIISIYQDCLEAMKKGNKDLLDDIIARDITINRVSNFCRRLLNKKGTADIAVLPSTYYIVEDLENLGDRLKNMCKYLLENHGHSVSPKVMEIFERVVRLLSDYHPLFFKYSHEGGKAFKGAVRNAENLLHDAFTKTKSVNDLRALCFISSMLQHLDDMSGPLMTLHTPRLCRVVER